MQSSTLLPVTGALLAAVLVQIPKQRFAASQVSRMLPINALYLQGTLHSDRTCGPAGGRLRPLAAARNPPSLWGAPASL